MHSLSMHALHESSHRLELFHLELVLDILQPLLLKLIVQALYNVLIALTDSQQDIYTPVHSPATVGNFRLCKFFICSYPFKYFVF